MCTKKRLTVLIPFLNEGEEVVTTVQEVRRTVGNEVDIVVVNDGSTDNWDYERLLQPYNIVYISNPHNLGSAPSRDICVGNCQTPYFLFLDAHMRFYENDWHIKLINLLNQDSRRILCAQTICLEKNGQGTVTRTQKQQKTYGAYMPLLVGDNIPDIKWNNIEFNPNASVEPIPYVLGAAYAGSVEYWNYLKGMQGLKKYGCEEQYISIKAWLDGGGFISLSSSNVSALQNINCPQNGGACSADGNVNTTNVNCPFEGGKCSGSADTSHDVVNLNCTQNGGSCTGTVAPTTSEDTTSMSAKNLLGLSMLV